MEKQINALGDMQKSNASDSEGGTVQKEVADIERSNGESLGEVATDLDGELSKMPMNRGDRRRARSENADDALPCSEMEMDTSLCSTKAGAKYVTSTGAE